MRSKLSTPIPGAATTGCKGQTVTIRSTVDDLIVDYAHHAEQIRGLTKDRS
jgi:hypothetical protein